MPQSTGLGRYVRVLHLFSEEAPSWTIPAMASRLSVPASTLYRTVRELVAADMLEQATEASYRLGAAFVEFDRLVRITDPLIQNGAGLLVDVAAQAQLPCSAVLARLYGGTVMCIADARSKLGHPPTSLERGRPRPLTRGAVSKMILAQLPARRLAKLLHKAQLNREMSPSQIEALRLGLSSARKAGYVIARGEVDEGLVGFAAPVLMPEQAIAASLCLVAYAKLLNEATEQRLILLVTLSAKLLTERLVDSVAADS